MKASRLTLHRVLKCIAGGCYTAQSIGVEMLELHGTKMRDAEIKRYMKILVKNGRAEWRNQGPVYGARGAPIKLCMPKGEVLGSNYHSNRPRGDENQI